MDKRPSIDEIIGAHHQDLARYVSGAFKSGLSGEARVTGFAKLKQEHAGPVEYPMSPNVALATEKAPNGIEGALIEASSKHAYRDALKAERLRSEAYLDELTGINNRRSIDRLTEDAVSGNEPGTVIMYDLDGFKEVNDTFGHEAGDDLLKLVAQTLNERVRAHDDVDYARPDSTYDGHVGRYGGDEFIVVLHGVDEHTGYKRASDMNVALNETLEPYKAGSSFGWASFEPGSDPVEVRKLADERMYADKRAKDVSR